MSHVIIDLQCTVNQQGQLNVPVPNKATRESQPVF